jgi:hypothetical protein
MSDKKLPKHMRKSRREKNTDKLVDSMHEQYGPKGSRTAFGITRSEFKRAEDPDDKKGIEKDIKDIDDKIASKTNRMKQAGAAQRLGAKKSRLKKKLKKLYGQGSFVAAENAKMIQPRKAKYKSD